MLHRDSVHYGEPVWISLKATGELGQVASSAVWYCVAVTQSELEGVCLFVCLVVRLRRFFIFFLFSLDHQPNGMWHGFCSFLNLNGLSFAFSISAFLQDPKPPSYHLDSNSVKQLQSSSWRFMGAVRRALAVKTTIAVNKRMSSWRGALPSLPEV